MPLTDSVRLLKHLDSLPPIKFPFGSEAYNRNFNSINLSEFKGKKLFKLKFTRIPTTIGSGGLDDDRIDSTFNLTDIQYKAQWNLIKKTPKFVVVEVNSEGAMLVTLNYHLEVIDAIITGIADPGGHYPWFASRHSVINNNLTILLQHEYTMNETEDSVDKEKSEEKWFIDKTGHFRKKAKQ